MTVSRFQIANGGAFPAENFKGFCYHVIDTALVGAANERTIPVPGYDHKGICRHGFAGDNGLKLILFQIKDIL
jgi:hypothetical protein